MEKWLKRKVAFCCRAICKFVCMYVWAEYVYVCTVSPYGLIFGINIAWKHELLCIDTRNLFRLWMKSVEGVSMGACIMAMVWAYVRKEKWSDAKHSFTVILCQYSCETNDTGAKFICLQGDTVFMCANTCTHIYIRNCLSPMRIFFSSSFPLPVLDLLFVCYYFPEVKQ